MSIKARFQLKNDTETNWNKAINFVPLRGEVIVYSIDDSHPFFRLKIGDGIHTIIELPFIDSSSIEGKKIIVDTTANWREKIRYIPNNGDILIYLDKTTINGVNIPGIKIGDGLTYGIDLPFIGDEIAYQLAQHTGVLDHKLTFGAGQQYVFDGSEDVTVPVYLGTYRE